ncbi:MAG: GNAT family N-acetyltransferase, partial [Oscillospiraceae bacterium]
MIREITEKDREIYLELAREFYTSPAVAHAVPDSYLVNTFEVLVRGSEYARGYMLESDGEAGGYALLAKTYSQEAGGCVLWVEEVYLRPEFRSKGLGGEF